MASRNSIPDCSMIPQLEGQNNFKEWEKAVRLQLQLADLEGFIDGTATPPKDDATVPEKLSYKLRQLTAYTIIRTTIDPVMELLQKEEYEDDTKDLDPEFLWDSVNEALYSSAAQRTLLFELTNLDFKDSGNLRAYLNHFNSLTRMLRMRGVDTDEMMLQCLLVNGLKSYDAQWATSLRYQLDRNNISYSSLVDLVTQRAAKEQAS